MRLGVYCVMFRVEPTRSYKRLRSNRRILARDYQSHDLPIFFTSVTPAFRIKSKRIAFAISSSPSTRLLRLWQRYKHFNSNLMHRVIRQEFFEHHLIFLNPPESLGTACHTRRSRASIRLRAVLCDQTVIALFAGHAVEAIRQCRAYCAFPKHHTIRSANLFPRLVESLCGAAFKAEARSGIWSFLVVGSFDHVLRKLYPGFYGVAVKAGVSPGD